MIFKVLALLMIKVLIYCHWFSAASATICMSSAYFKETGFTGTKQSKTQIPEHRLKMNITGKQRAKHINKYIYTYNNIPLPGKPLGSLPVPSPDEGGW